MAFEYCLRHLKTKIVLASTHNPRVFTVFFQIQTFYIWEFEIINIFGPNQTYLIMQGLKYTVDIVLCIDCTASMTGIMNTVKEKALKFNADLNRSLEAKDKFIDTLRLKVIAFRDFYVDGADAIHESPFYNLPEQQNEFHNFVNALVPKGGGDEPESGLEALALAMRSTWNKTGDKRREIIVVYTDAPAHALNSSHSKPGNYPTDIPKTFNELVDWWTGQETYVSQSAQRLIIYAPDAEPWSEIGNEWENAVHYASQAGEGLAELDYDTILSAIVKSV
jgi:hypothetical protein